MILVLLLLLLQVMATTSELWRQHTLAEERLKQLETDINTLAANNFTKPLQ